jgi:hypothetical protein
MGQRYPIVALPDLGMRKLNSGLDARYTATRSTKNIAGEPMPAAKKSAIPADKLELYNKLIATNPAIDRKGATHPYTSLNGNMFTLFNPPGALAIRLSEAEREKFMKKYKTGLFEAYGAVMKEYVAVPDALLSKTKELAKWLDLSYEYAKTLKPKATKK